MQKELEPNLKLATMSHSINSKSDYLNMMNLEMDDDFEDDEIRDIREKEEKKNKKRASDREKAKSPTPTPRPPSPARKKTPVFEESYSAPPPPAPKPAAKKASPPPPVAPTPEQPVETLEVILRKIDSYMKHPAFRDLFTNEERNEWDLDEALKSYSLKKAQLFISDIRARLKSSFKLAMVDNMFEAMTGGSEAMMVNFMQMKHMMGFGEHCKKNKILFDRELAELAIEMSDDYVPSPKLRLMFKALTLATEYHRIRYNGVEEEEGKEAKN